MAQLNLFIDLIRLKKPIGFMLLFWPCAWGISYAYFFDQDTNKFYYHLLLFFFGSILMRSAGCIVNDLVDKDFDKKVSRTKNRPIASKKITSLRALVYALTLCSIAFLILIQFNFKTILLGMASMTLAFSYPYMKRFTYWPQLFLGLTFNWGIIMGWSSITNSINFEIILLYVAAIFWTLGYDTIYGAQDIRDDEIIGVKSTSIKFKKNIKKFVSLNYIISTIFLIYFFKSFLGLNLLTFFIFLFVLSLVYQIKIFDKKKPTTCLKAFKVNNLSGLILFFAFLSIGS